MVQIKFFMALNANAQWEKGCFPGFVCQKSYTNRPDDLEPKTNYFHERELTRFEGMPVRISEPAAAEQRHEPDLLI
jgi:hypothetical protein